MSVNERRWKKMRENFELGQSTAKKEKKKKELNGEGSQKRGMIV